MKTQEAQKTFVKIGIRKAYLVACQFYYIYILMGKVRKLKRGAIV